MQGEQHKVYIILYDIVGAVEKGSFYHGAGMPVSQCFIRIISGL